jgi:hypothetical protein
MSNQSIEDDTTRATARLPGLDIEIVHRRSLNDEAEQITINVQAVPFEAFGRLLETANSFALWAQTAQIAWFPWLNAARSLMLPWSVASAPPKLSSSGNETPSDVWARSPSQRLSGLLIGPFLRRRKRPVRELSASTL